MIANQYMEYLFRNQVWQMSEFDILFVVKLITMNKYGSVCGI